MRLTVFDYIERARAGEEGAFEAGFARAHDFHEVRALLALADGLSTDAWQRLCARLLEFAIADAVVWGFRDVAAQRLSRGDKAGARAALDEGMRVFAERGVQGYQWVLLSTGFFETLGDAEAGRRCLEAGTAQVLKAEGRCDLAVAWGQRISNEEGRARLAALPVGELRAHAPRHIAAHRGHDGERSTWRRRRLLVPRSHAVSPVSSPTACSYTNMHFAERRYGPGRSDEAPAGAGAISRPRASAHLTLALG